MRAVVQERYGPPDLLEVREIDRPAVRDREVLVRVHATTVAGDDWHLLQGLPYVARMATGLRRPKHVIPGRDLAGHVEAVGAGVRRLRPGDEVFGWCDGALAEYASVAEDALAPRPANVTLEQAAALPICGLTALQALRDEGQVRRGQSVLILGASGGVGTLAVQIAKAYGAEVTAVCSARNADLVRSLGADQVLDYAREDFTRGGRRWDLILDMVGNRSLSDCRRALRPGGTLVMVGSSGRARPGSPRLAISDRWFMGTERWLGGLVLSAFVRQRLRPLVHRDRREDLLFLKELVEAGKVTPVVDRQYALGDVSMALRHLEGAHAGKVVVTV